MPNKIVGFFSAFSIIGLADAAAAVEDREYFDSIEECDNSWLSSGLVDECYICLRGANGEIAEVDGSMADKNGVRYVYDNSDDTTWCEIVDERWTACSAGFYGFPWEADDYALRGCSQCPSGGTSDILWGQEKDITDCYIAVNTPQKDSSGTYIYLSDCYYVK